MWMVVMLHVFGNGQVLGNTTTGSANWLLGNILNSFCIVAVNCFALISGYFLCTSRFKLKKLGAIWTMCAVWSVILYCLASFVLGTDVFSVSGLIKSLLVFTWQPWWYVTQYILLYLCIPFLNAAIQSMTKGKHLACCMVAIFVFSLLPTITIFGSDFSGIGTGFSFIWLICLYLVASYIRLHVSQPAKVQYRWLMAYLVCVMVTSAECILRDVITISGKMNLFYAYNSIVCFCSSLGLFMFFRSVQISSDLVASVTSSIAPLTLAVFLIHHYPQNKVWLWDTLHPYTYANSPIMIPYAIGCSLLIYIVCIGAEFLRIKLFTITQIEKLIDWLCDFFQRWIQKSIWV